MRPVCIKNKTGLHAAVIRPKEVNLVAKDPVCNMDVDEKKAAATSLYKGETYYFCAKICKEKFEKEPEKYSKKEEG